MKLTANLKIGKWTLIERVEKKWMCACECGTRKLVFPNNLRDGRSKSCGCASRALHNKKMASAFPNKEPLHA